MKNLIFVGGTMGVGKTTTCDLLKKQLPNCVFLDGDWCWDAHPFVVTAETREMVLDNIAYLLGNFLRCSAYENILLCWVLHQDEIAQALLNRLDGLSFHLHRFSLTCSEQVLRARIGADLQAGIRTEDVLKRSLERLPLYDALNTVLLDTSTWTPLETAQVLCQQILSQNL